MRENIRGRKHRSLKELYADTVEVLEPKVTAVSRGDSLIPKPANEVDGSQLSMETLGPDGLDYGLYPCRKSHTKEESEIYNVCDSMDSSSIHFNRVALDMHRKHDEFPLKPCREKVTSPHVINGADVLSLSTSKAQPVISSGTSNPLSACSDRDSFSENAESKATLRASFPSEDNKILESTDLSIIAGNFGGKKGSDNLGDNISLICGSITTSGMARAQNHDSHHKNVLCSLASVDSSPPVREAICSKNTDQSRGIPKSIKQSLRIADFQNKSDPKENSAFKSIYAGHGSLKGEEAFDCSVGQSESSLIKAQTRRVASHICNEHDRNDLVKSDPPMTEKDVAAEAKSAEEDESLKPGILVNKSNTQIGSFKTVNAKGAMETAEVEVRVCDICGDAGRETLLAICSKCSDGAEHTYCMKLMLKEIPGDWVCEECALLAETEEKRSGKSQNGSKNLEEASSQNESAKQSVTLCDSVFPSSTKHGVRAPCSMKRKTFEPPSRISVVGSSPVSVTKRKSMETSVGPPRASMTYSKSQHHRNTPVDLEKWRINPAGKVTVSGSQSSARPLEVLHPAANIGLKSPPRLQSQARISKSSLSESKSLNTAESKRETQELLGESMSLNHANSKQMDHSRCKRLKRLRRDNSVQKRPKLDPPNSSSSLCRIGSAGSSSIADEKNLPMSSINNSGVSVARTNTQNSSMSSPLIGSGVSTSKTDKEHAATASSGIPTSKTDKANPLVNTPMISSDVSTPKSNRGNGPISSVVASSVVPASMSEERAASGGTREPQFSRESRDMKSAVHDRSSFQQGSHLMSAEGKYRTGEKSGASSDIRQPEQPTSLASKIGENNLCVITPPVERPCSRDTPCAMFCAAIALQDSKIPDINRAWVGEFEIYSTGRPPRFFKGIQAHLSIGAATKVKEAVEKLPSKMLLWELPRLSTWPNRFLGEGPMEDDIALYFFAEDLKSYKNYKGLVDFMIENDLALKGDFEGVELIIFTSNVLPEGGQRWNSDMFLWGVLSRSLAQPSGPTAGAQEKIFSLDLNNIPCEPMKERSQDDTEPRVAKEPGFLALSLGLSGSNEDLPPESGPGKEVRPEGSSANTCLTLFGHVIKF